jgi:hypothetical protein
LRRFLSAFWGRFTPVFICFFRAVLSAFFDVLRRALSAFSSVRTAVFISTA